MSITRYSPLSRTKRPPIMTVDDAGMYVSLKDHDREVASYKDAMESDTEIINILQRRVGRLRGERDEAIVARIDHEHLRARLKALETED